MLLITKGLGDQGDRTESSLLTTAGLGGLGQMPFGVNAFQVIRSESFGTYIVLDFTSNLIIGGNGVDPSKYILTPYNQVAANVKINRVTVLEDSRIRLDCQDQTIGQIYSLALPQVGIVSQDHRELNAPYEIDVLGLGTPVFISMSRAIDCRQLEIVFSEEVEFADAVQVNNYAITPELLVKSVRRVDNWRYVLTTDRMTELVEYEVDVENIRGLDHNVIVQQDV